VRDAFHDSGSPRVPFDVIVTTVRSPAELVALYSDIGRELLAQGDRSTALTAVTRVAVSHVPGTEWASITEGRNGRFATITATDDAARAADEIQYELGSGPCVDAVLQDTTFRTGDLRGDDRWSAFGQRAADAFGVRSMLSFRLHHDDDDRIVGLNLYATKPDAFDDDAVVIGTLVATHGALATEAASARENADQLQRALMNSRDIGTAVGILMSQHKIARDQAFSLLRIASQNSNRKVIDIAADVVRTGALDLRVARARRSQVAHPGRA
jgi:ANTAR domain-containing protein/GAF domain-containing protein